MCDSFHSLSIRLATEQTFTLNILSNYGFFTEQVVPENVMQTKCRLCTRDVEKIAFLTPPFFFLSCRATMLIQSAK